MFTRIIDILEVYKKLHGSPPRGSSWMLLMTLCHAVLLAFIMLIHLDDTMKRNMRACHARDFILFVHVSFTMLYENGMLSHVDEPTCIYVGDLEVYTD